MATTTPEPAKALARFDHAYDLYRDCLLNQEYYGHRLNLFTKVALWLEIVIVLGSGASGISGWIIWTKYPQLAVLWGIIAAASTLLAGLKPVLHTDTKLKRYSSLFSGYRQLAISMKMVVEDIADAGGISKEANREIDRIRSRYRTLAADDDPRPPSTLVERLQNEINQRVPASSLFYPRPGAAQPADNPEMALTASDIGAGVDTKIDPVAPWPRG